MKVLDCLEDALRHGEKVGTMRYPMAHKTRCVLIDDGPSFRTAHGHVPESRFQTSRSTKRLLKLEARGIR